MSICRLWNLPITQSIDWCKDVAHPYILFSTVIYCYLFHSFLLLTTITTECTLLVYNRQRYCSVWTDKPRTLYNWGICKSVNCVIDRLCDCLIPQCTNWQIPQFMNHVINRLCKLMMDRFFNWQTVWLIDSTIYRLINVMTCVTLLASQENHRMWNVESNNHTIHRLRKLSIHQLRNLGIHR